MSFQTATRILAVSPGSVEALFSQLVATYGEDLPDGREIVKTIGAHWDDTEHTRIRAATFPTTITGIPLTDGRVAFVAMWQADLAAEFDTNGLLGVEELTKEQFAGLIPQPEEELI
jgi:hypothetical protein